MGKWNGKIPVDENGSVPCSLPYGSDTEAPFIAYTFGGVAKKWVMNDNLIFQDKLTDFKFTKGYRSKPRVLAKSGVHPKRVYYISLSDFEKMIPKIQDGSCIGKFTYKKHGDRYLTKFVEG